MAVEQRDPRAERVLALYEDLQAISAVGDGVLVPHLRRLMSAAVANRSALYAAIARWREGR